MKTLVQVSKELNIPKDTLISAARTGRIPAEKIGRDWFVYDSEPKFEQFLKTYRAKEEKK
jgi:hypothetical protein